MSTTLETPKPASGADVAKLHSIKRRATTAFAEAGRAYDEALQAFEHAVLVKNRRRLDLAKAVTAYETAKAEADQ